jgi:hypothetical protein
MVISDRTKGCPFELKLTALACHTQFAELDAHNTNSAVTHVSGRLGVGIEPRSRLSPPAKARTVKTEPRHGSPADSCCYSWRGRQTGPVSRARASRYRRGAALWCETKKADVVNPALFIPGGDAARPNSGERETFDRVKNRSSSPPVSSRPLSSWWSAAPIPVASFDQAAVLCSLIATQKASGFSS